MLQFVKISYKFKGLKMKFSQIQMGLGDLTELDSYSVQQVWIFTQKGFMLIFTICI